MYLKVDAGSIFIYELRMHVDFATFLTKYMQLNVIENCYLSHCACRMVY